MNVSFLENMGAPTWNAHTDMILKLLMLNIMAGLYIIALKLHFYSSK